MQFPILKKRLTLCFLQALKAEKVKLAACGRNHTLVYTCKFVHVTNIRPQMSVV